jgi:hypothetical protein
MTADFARDPRFFLASEYSIAKSSFISPKYQDAKMLLPRGALSPVVTWI